MASVINSARASTASVFGLVGQTAEAGSLLIGTGICAIGALDAKARLMRDEVVRDCNLKRAGGTSAAVQRAASDHVDIMEEIFRKNFPGQVFDRTAAFQSAVTMFESALTD